MPKIDIRKHASSSVVHYEPLGKRVFATDIARLRGLTPSGRKFLGRSAEYCRMERALIARLLAGKPISKPAVMAEFGFPGRMFNAALDSAGGLVDSARACAQLALDGTREALTRGLAHYWEAEADPSRQGELPGRRRRIAKQVEQEARHERIAVRPGIFPGGKVYRTQHKDPAWKRTYLARRADHIGANGGADEVCGNQTLQVALGPVEVVNARLWQWFELKHARGPMGRFRLWVSECEGLVRAVLANAEPRRTALVDVWFDEAGKKIGPARQAKMAAAGLTPASIRKTPRTVTAKRVAFTIALRRQDSNRWYIHLSREDKDLPRTTTPVAWMGVDINCDSIAHAVVSMRDGAPVIESYAKDYFPSTGPAGERIAGLHAIINRRVDEARERQLGVSLEYLDFEHCKRWLKTKLGALLHVMPYRRIRGIFERRCLELGVPLRYVPPKYSSLLGAVLCAKWPMLGRDQAAGAVMALRASEVGNPWLEQACEQAAKAERVSLRLNAKRKFGHTIMVEDFGPQPTSNTDGGRQADRPPFPVEPALKWQVLCGRKVRGALSTLSALRADSLRKVRRAAKAQRRVQSDSPPRFKMPKCIRLDLAQPHGSGQRSSLRNAA